MKLFKFHALIIFFSSVLSICAYAIVNNDYGLLAVAGTLICISWICTEGPTAIYLSPFMSRVFSFIALCYSIIDIQIEVDLIINSLSEFVVWILVLKMFERRSASIELQRVLLGLLCFVVASMQANSMIFLFVLVLWLMLVVCFLMSFTILSEWRVQDKLFYVDNNLFKESNLPQFEKENNMQFHFYKAFLLTFCSLISLSLFLFIVFPRSNSRNFSEASRQDVGDLSTIRLSTDQNIIVSKQEVATVSFEDFNGNILPRFDQPLRLRSATLTYNPEIEIWDSGYSASQVDSYARVIPVGEESFKKVIVQKTNLIRSLAQLPLAGSPLVIKTFPVTSLSVIKESDTCIVQNLDNMPKRYEAILFPFIDSQIELSPSLNESKSYPNEAVAELTRNILQSSGIEMPIGNHSDFAFNRASAEAIKNWFRTGSFSYTTNLFFDVGRSNDLEDPIEKFLLKDRRGHCEFFATSMSAMLSTILVPSRVVTGFVTDQYQESENHYLVSASNAHSWVEVATSPDRWSFFDPTPASGNPELVSKKLSWRDWFSWKYKTLESWFQVVILGYDSKLQSNFFVSLRSGFEKIYSIVFVYFKSRFDFISDFILSNFFELYYLIFLLFFSITIVCVFIYKMFTRVKYIKLLGDNKKIILSKSAQSVIFYGHALHLCKKRGWIRRLNQTPLEFSNYIKSQDYEFGQNMIKLTHMFYRIRFGKKSLNSANKIEIKHIFKGLKK